MSSNLEVDKTEVYKSTYPYIVYASRLLNNVEWIYNCAKHKALDMVFTLHKFRDYLSNKFVFYVDHMAMVYLMNKSQVSHHIAR